MQVLGGLCDRRASERKERTWRKSVCECENTDVQYKVVSMQKLFVRWMDVKQI